MLGTYPDILQLIEADLEELSVGRDQRSLAAQQSRRSAGEYAADALRSLLSSFLSPSLLVKLILEIRGRQAQE